MIEDALHPRMAGSTEGMTLQVLAQIRDSLTALTRDVRSANEATSDVRERVIRLEERDKRLDDLEADMKAADLKIGILMRDKDNRDGANKFLSKVPNWLSFLVALGSVFSAVYLLGRQVGFVPAPPVQPARVEAVIHPEERRIEGIVGGKP
ncbi:MAG: hypothetical protein ABWY12_12110 [Burkholderiales bacterium]